MLVEVAEEAEDAELTSSEVLGDLCRLCVLVRYALSGSNCGVKSLAAPGTLYSYGPR